MSYATNNPSKLKTQNLSLIQQPGVPDESNQDSLSRIVVIW